MNNKTLFVIAAGLSTRFNGQPKHLAKIKNRYVLENTLALASNYYDLIYVVVNCQADFSTIETTRNIAKAYNANIIEIYSGKGDADAVYRAINSIDVVGNVSICWGDAWFNTSNIFEIASQSIDIDMSDNVFNAFCAIEDNPYGWFELETDSKTIKYAAFKNELDYDIKKDNAIHDQCFFNINVKNFNSLFEAYEKAILVKKNDIETVIKNGNSLFKIAIKYEISWYKMINWEKYIRNNSGNANFGKSSIVTILDKSNVMSFNTKEDLKEIEKHA